MFIKSLYILQGGNLLMTDVQVENIVVSFQVASVLDLQKLAEALPDVKYNPEEVPAVVLQFQKPRSVVTLFSTGNVVVTGPKTMDEVNEIIKMVHDRLLVLGIQPDGIPSVSVQNVTASTHLQRRLDLKRLAKSLQQADYDPAVFPGVVYKGEDPNTVILLFDSGKVVCNAATLERVTGALDNMKEKLLTFGM
jgi:transcription initiation factor TFIID TATA-box-binding protein